MSYLNELLAGYWQGLTSNTPQSTQTVRAALTETDNPRQRGALLGMLACALASRGSTRSDTTKTSIPAQSVTHSADM